MGELIDRQALKDYVSSLSTHPLNEWDTWGVLAAIDKQPTITAPRWRRVEDVLPKAGKIVLACNDFGTVNVVYLASYGKWYAANNTMYDAWTWMPNVTHWMPLPEPPKEENNGSSRKEASSDL